MRPATRSRISGCPDGRRFYKRLRDQLIEHEGLKRRPYRCPAGKLTIGIGRNLEANGISEHEALYMLYNDLCRVQGSCWKTSCVSRLCPSRGASP